MNDLSQLFEKFGPTGMTIIMMGAGLVYITRWVRELQDKWIGQHETFTKALDAQREAHHESLKEVVVEFKQMHAELGAKVDKLADRIDSLRNKP